MNCDNDVGKGISQYKRYMLEPKPMVARLHQDRGLWTRLETVVREMQSHKDRIPPRHTPCFMGRSSEAFSRKDMVRWLRQFGADTVDEANHLGTLLSYHGYCYRIEEHVVIRPDDDSMNRFQNEKYWPSIGWEPDNYNYAIYLIKRSFSSKARLELADYEIDTLSRLQRTLSRDWDKLVHYAETLLRAEKRKDKSERKITECQDRAFWNVHRPTPGQPNTYEQDMRKRMRNNIRASHEKLALMGPSERIEMKQKNLKRLQAEKEMLESALEKPCHRFSKAIETLLSHCEARQRIDPMLPESTITGSNSWTSRDQSVSESEPLRWKHSLHDLLRSSDGEEAFAKFLRSEYSGENLTFWLAAKRYKRGPVSRQRTVAQAIYDRHISDDCQEPVNLPQSHHRMITQSLSEQTVSLTRFLFEDAAQHIFNLMRTDSYTRFLSSSIYQDIIVNIKDKYA